MSLLFAILIWALVFAVLCWIVSILPLPPQPSFLRNVLYVLVGLFALVVLLNLVGWIDPFGWHPVRYR